VVDEEQVERTEDKDEEDDLDEKKRRRKCMLRWSTSESAGGKG